MTNNQQSQTGNSGTYGDENFLLSFDGLSQQERESLLEDWWNEAEKERETVEHEGIPSCAKIDSFIDFDTDWEA